MQDESKALVISSPSVQGFGQFVGDLVPVGDAATWCSAMRRLEGADKCPRRFHTLSRQILDYSSEGSLPVLISGISDHIAINQTVEIALRDCHTCCAWGRYV